MSYEKTVHSADMGRVDRMSLRISLDHSKTKKRTTVQKFDAFALASKQMQSEIFFGSATGIPPGLRGSFILR
jgi:hypothetical protein